MYGRFLLAIWSYYLLLSVYRMIVFSKKLNQDCLRLKFHLFLNINLRHLKKLGWYYFCVQISTLKNAMFCALKALLFTAVV